MRSRVTRCIEAAQFHRMADAYQVAALEAAGNAADTLCRGRMRQYRRAGGRDHRGVAAGMIGMLVGIEDLADAPAELPCTAQASLGVERIDCERLAGVAAGDQIMKVAAPIGGPDTFDQHGAYLGMTARSGTATASGGDCSPDNKTIISPGIA